MADLFTFVPLQVRMWLNSEQVLDTSLKERELEGKPDGRKGRKKDKRERENSGGIEGHLVGVLLKM